jgi:hypothetical protein
MRHFVLLPLLALAGALSALAGVDNGLLAMLPAGSKVVVGVDVTHARDSQFGQFMLTKIQADDPQLQQMIQETGFDPRRDLESILVGISGVGKAGAASSFVVLARGTFDIAHIREASMAKGATAQTYQGVELLVRSQDPKNQTGFAFPSAGTAVMGSLEIVKQVIARRGSPVSLDPQLKSQINGVGSANDVWYVSLVGGDVFADHAAKGPADGMHDGNGVQDMLAQGQVLQGIVQSSGGLKFGSMIEATLDAVTRSEKDAQSLTDVIRFFASMVQTQRQNDPRAKILADALDAMTLQNTGTAVHVAVSFPEETMQQLAEMGRSGHRPHQGGFR